MLQSLNDYIEERNKQCLEAIQWLNRRGIKVERVVLTQNKTVIILINKPYYDLERTETLMIVGSNKGRIIHLTAPLKGCEVRWSESLQ